MQKKKKPQKRHTQKMKKLLDEARHGKVRWMIHELKSQILQNIYCLSNPLNRCIGLQKENMFLQLLLLLFSMPSLIRLELFLLQKHDHNLSC